MFSPPEGADLIPAPPLEVAFSGRQQWGSLLVLGLFGIGFLAAGITGTVPRWLSVVGVAEMVLVILFGVVGVARGRGAGVVLRLDNSGVTVRHDLHVPWSDLRELVIGPLRPAWFVASKRYPVLAFLPQAGVELPDPPYWGRRRYAWGRRTRARWYGTPLTVLPHTLTATAEQIAAAADRLGGVPTRRLQIRRFTKAFFVARGVLLLVAVAVGFLAAWLG